MTDEAASESDTGRPAWFDAERHVVTDSGVMERDTGLWLAGDGLPQAAPARARRLAVAGIDIDELGIVDAVWIASATIQLERERLAAEVDAAARVSTGLPTGVVTEPGPGGEPDGGSVGRTDENLNPRGPRAPSKDD